MDNFTASWLGFGVGLILACLPIYLIGLLVGLAMKAKEPDERALYAALGAWIITYALAGWGFANGGPYRFDAGLMYIPAAAIAFLMLRHHYLRMWRPDDE